MAAPKTVKTVTLDGSTKDFEIPFEYLARKFVVLTLIGVDRKELVLNVDYRFTQRTIVTTTQVWGPGTGYTLLEIKRVTSATERLVDFSDGSILRASDLNTATVQALHIAEEGRDIATDTIGVDNAGNLDARGRRIVNLADAINPGDTVTLKQNQEWGGSALNQANRAEQQANLANTARVGAEAAQSAAQSYRDQSGASASEAKQWATYPVDQLVRPGLYSALHYATKAAGSQDIAFQAMVRSEAARDRSETAATTATQQAGTATTQAGIAKTEADRAKTEADKLGNANAFMGTLSKVEGLKPYWKDGGQFYERLGFKRSGAAESAYADQVELIHGAAGRFALYDGLRGMSRWYSDPNGDFVPYGALYARGVYSQSGSIFTVAPADGSNSNFWFEGPSGNRGVIYAGIDQVIRFRAGTSNVGLSVNPNGDISVGRNVALGASYIESDGNITSSIYPGGSLASTLTILNTGTRRMTRTQLYTGAVGNGQLLVLSDDVFNYESLHVNFGSSTGVLMSLTGLRELANLPIGTKFNINHAAQGAVDMSFEDTDPNQRRRLRMGNFTASGWFNLYGMKSRAY